MASSQNTRLHKLFKVSKMSNHKNWQHGITNSPPLSNHESPTAAASSFDSSNTCEPNVSMEFSPHTPSTKAPALNVTDEELSKYFSNADSIPKVSSPISNHLELVKATMIGEFPTDMAKVKTLRTSLFKLASSLDIPLPMREIFNQVALQINDLAFKYRLSKESYDDASFELKKLKELQEQKSQFHASYVDIEKEKKSILTRQKEIEDRTTILNTRMEEIIQEIWNLKTESTQLTSQLTHFSDQRVNLYAESTSLDHEIVLLLSQKVGLERDLKNGSEGITEVNKTWDSLLKMLAEVSLEVDI